MNGSYGIERFIYEKPMQYWIFNTRQFYLFSSYFYATQFQTISVNNFLKININVFNRL